MRIGGWGQWEVPRQRKQRRNVSSSPSAPIMHPWNNGMELSRSFDLKFVPSLFLIDPAGRVLRSHFGFDKSLLDEIAAQMGCAPVADQFDGAPQNKPGCISRHLEREGRWRLRTSNRQPLLARPSGLGPRSSGRRGSLRVLLPHVRRRTAGNSSYARSHRAHAQRCSARPERNNRTRAAVLWRSHGRENCCKRCDGGLRPGCDASIAAVSSSGLR